MPSRPDIEDLLSQARWMSALVRGLVANESDVEDVVQETWLRALRTGPRDVGRTAASRRWLRTVASRIAARRAESEMARRRREAAVARPESGFDHAEYEQRVELQRDLANHLLQLDGTSRAAVLMKYQDGLSSAEIGERLGISPEAARQRISRGLVRLRESLERERGGRPEWIVAFAPLLRAHPAVVSQGAVAPVVATSMSWAVSVGCVAVAVAALAVWWIRASGAATPITLESREVAASPMPGSRALDAREPVAAVAGSRAPVDRLRDVHGAVTFEGQPAAGWEIELRRAEDTAFRLSDYAPRTPIVVARTRTDADGEFVLPPVELDRCDVHVRGPTGALQIIPDLRPGERVDVDVQPPATLAGIVEADASGAPCPQASLRFTAMWDSGIARCVATAATDARGAFTVRLPPGRHIVEVASPIAGGAVAVLDLAPREHVDTRLRLMGVQIVRGTIVERESDAPVAGATIVAGRAYEATEAPRRPRPEVVGRGWRNQTAVESDAAGRFEVAIPGGLFDAQIHVTAPGYGARGFVVRAAGAELRLGLQRGAVLRGRVVGPNGGPRLGVHAVLAASGIQDGYEHGSWHECETDADGRFAFDGVRTDLHGHRVLLTDPEFGRSSVACPLELREGPSELATIALAEPASCSGTLVDAAGAPACGVYLVVCDREGETRTLRTDDLGRFACSGLPPGSYEIRVASAVLLQDLELVAGQRSVGQVLRLPPRERVVGVVHDALGEPLLNALVLLIPPGPDARALRGVTDRDGNFRFDGVTPGAYRLRVAPNSIHLAGGNRLVHGVELHDVVPSHASLSVVLPPAAMIRGLVVDSGGEPRAGIIVFARGADHAIVTYETTDAEGAFVLRVPPDAVVDLCVGRRSRRDVRVAGVTAGTAGLRIPFVD